MKISLSKVKKFQKEILQWYEKNKRPLPWRETRDPYKILVSEVMSQQTQISRVIPKYLEWIKRFPTLQSLAEASTREVLLCWNGLGYNRRALYLQKCARVLIQKTQASVLLRNTQQVEKLEAQKNKSSDSSSISKINWPQTEKELKKLPGIGEYTSRALLCFAFDKQIAVVDTNVRRVILTQFQIQNDKFQRSNKEFQEIADELLPHGHAYEWNQALMDYASAMLKNHKIPILKQSTFKNSDRYFRGEILRVLLKEKKISFISLEKHFQSISKTIATERLRKILQELEKDGFILGNTEIFEII